ncbi:MAG TPA: GrpB family protein [Armatimonadota bacterium]|jgi:GrpB-like predicted nucleotidyltransferase (UPF0157 family)
MIGLKRHALRFAERQAQWNALFAEECGLLERMLGDLILAVELVGSTAVAGLAAKPILDIAAAICSRKTIPDISSRLTPRPCRDRCEAGRNGGYRFG